MKEVRMLFCKNRPVYNIATEEVYNGYLLPGYMQKNPCDATFKAWLKTRYSTRANSIASQLKGTVFGKSNRVVINRTTKALSLCDCYWVKSSEDPVSFEQVSPYYASFWTGAGMYGGQAIPTLYVNGYRDKRWVSANTLEKYGKLLGVEYDASVLCKLCAIPVVDVRIIDGGVAVRNFTSPKYMLEQLDQSGKVDINNFSDADIIRLFGIRGIQMIVIDAILGNGDRHADNIGWLRDTDTGKYVCMSPLYDFDRVLGSRTSSDSLIYDAVKAVLDSGNSDYIREAVRVCSTVLGADTSGSMDVYKKRASVMLKELTSK